MKCEHCGDGTINKVVIHGTELWCWPCHDATKGTIVKTNSVITDDIPGGIEIRHGLVTENGEPMKFYSKSAIHAEAKRRGLVNLVEHKPLPGSDKSPYTTRWI